LPNNKNNKNLNFYSKIENFNISLEDDENYYVVIFTPKQLKGANTLGGGVKYKIDKRNHIIVEKIFSQ
jgi:hypothetical protein